MSSAPDYFAFHSVRFRAIILVIMTHYACVTQRSLSFVRRQVTFFMGLFFFNFFFLNSKKNLRIDTCKSTVYPFDADKIIVIYTVNSAIEVLTQL